MKRKITAILFFLFITTTNYFLGLSFSKDYPIPSFSSCFIGDEINIVDKYSFEAAPDSIVFLFGTDEGNYLRMAEQLRNGLVPSDNRAWVELRSLLDENPDNTTLNGTLSRQGLIDQFTKRHQYVSYRSVVFPLIFAPLLANHSCNAQGLSRLRHMVSLIGAMVPFLATMLVYLINERHRIAKSMVVGMLVAGDYQLVDAASTFLAELPGLVMLLSGLIVIGLSSRTASVYGAVMAGVVLSIAALIKLEFIYSVPIALIVAFFSWRPLSTNKKMIYSCAVVITLFLVLGGYGIRNHMHTGSYFITSKDAINLWLGNVSGVEKPLGFEEHKNALFDEHGFEIGMRKYYKEQLLSHLQKYPIDTFQKLVEKGRRFLFADQVNRFPWMGDFGYFFGVFINMVALAAVPVWIKGRWQPGTSPLAGFIMMFYVVSSGLVIAVFIVPRLLIFSNLFGLIIACCASIDLISGFHQRKKITIR